jgi:hypothetical protein
MGKIIYLEPFFSRRKVFIIDGAVIECRKGKLGKILGKQV